MRGKVYNRRASEASPPYQVGFDHKKKEGLGESNPSVKKKKKKRKKWDSRSEVGLDGEDGTCPGEEGVTKLEKEITR